MSESKQTWVKLAEQVVKELEEYDREHHTYYSYYLDDKYASEVLAEALEKANKKLMWQPTKEVD